MKPIRVWVPLAVLVGTLHSQTQIDLRTQSKSVDFSAAASTKPSQTGIVLPSTCSVGATYFNTAAPAGHNLYGCTSTNIWTLLGANLWFGGGNFNSGDCAAFNSSGNIVSAGGACGPVSSVTMASPFTVAGSLLVSAGPGRQAVASGCSNSGGTLSCPGGFSGNMSWLAGSGTNTRQILGPAGAFTNPFNYRWSDSIPTAATLMKIGTPMGGESSLGPAIPDTDYVTPSGAGVMQNKTFDSTNLFSSYLPWTQIATPATPVAGSLRVYGKIGGGLCWINPSGVETCAGGGVNDPGGSGVLTETAPGVMANRSITAGSANISIANGSGAGGNPTVDIGSTVDFSGKTTSPVQVGPAGAIPANCSAGQLYFAPDGVPGRQLQTCSSTNTWSPEAYAQGMVNPVTCSVGQVYFNTAASAGQNLFFCSTTNRWSQMAGSVATVFGRSGTITAQAGDYTYSQIANAPTALPPSGPASGDLSGSYPNPVVSQINGAIVPSSGVLKANTSRQLVPAAAGTDYAPPTSGSSLLKGNGAGGFAVATPGSDYMAVTTSLAPGQMPALTGDCVSSAGNVNTNCSRTNGKAFAASATTDTTNAANIATGILSTGRLPASVMQTNQSNTISGGTQDFHGAAHTLPVVTGPAAGRPSNCTVGEEYFATDATPGQNLYYCSSNSIWTQGITVSSMFGRTGAVTAQSGDYTYAQIANTPAALPPNGAASGDLSGSFPNPTVAQVNGAAIPSGGVLKANGNHQIVGAAAGTDFEVPLTFSGSLNRAGSTITCGAASGIAAGCLSSADWLTFSNKQNALTNPITGTGTVGGLAKFTAAGTLGSASAGADYAPATPGTALLKGNGGGGFAAAVAGADYAPATTGTSLLKGNSGGFSAAVAGVDYAPSTLGTSLLKGNNAGGFAAAAAGTDFAPATTGTGLLKANNGGFASAVAGFDFAAPPSGSSVLKANSGGFAAAVAGTDFAPPTSGTSILKANNGGFVNAVAGTDFAPPTSGTSLLKGNSTGGFASAVAGTDYAAPPTGSSLLKANNGAFAAAVAGTDYAPATSGTSLLKGDSSGGFAAAVAGTDYAPATSGTSLLKGNSTGGFATAVAGTDYAAPPAGTSILKAANGAFAAALAGTDYAPPTSGTSLLKGNSTGGFATAVAGTDYAAAPTGTSILKANNGAFTAAMAGTDYAPPTSGTSLLKGNSTGGFATAVAGTDYAPPTSGTSLLKGNSTGGFATAVAGTDYAAPPTGSSVLKANNGAFAAAVAGTDYAPPTSGTSLLKGNSTGGFATAVAGTDYAAPPTGSSVLKANNGAFAAAVAGTDYAPPTSGTSLLKGNSTGGFATAVAGTDYAAPPTGSSVLKANNGAFAAAVAGTDYAPPTSGTSLLKGNSTGGFATAVAGTDYAAPPTGSSVLKANNGAFAAAVAGTDYAPATSGTSLLKGNNTGGFANAISGTDYAPATSGTSLLKGNSTGGFATAVAGLDYAAPPVGTSLLKANNGGFAAAVAGTDYAPPTSGTSLLKGNSTGGFATAVAGTDYAPATSGTGLLKGDGTGGFGSASASDVVNSFLGCSGIQYLGADGACHAVSAGSGYVSLSTGAGPPASNCTAPSASNLAIYLDSTNGDQWWCYSTNSWKKTLSVTGSGPYQVVGQTGSAPSPPASGMVTCYFDQTTLTQVCLNSSGGASTMVAGTSGATANSFVTYIDAAGLQHVAQPAISGLTGSLAASQMPALTGDLAGTAGLLSVQVTATHLSSALPVVQGGTGQTTYTPTLTIATGTVATNVGAIASGACSSVVTATATGAVHGDGLWAHFDGDPTSTTGWSPSTSGSLYIYGWITSGQVNFKICNNTASAVTPGTTEDTIDWGINR